MVTQGSRWVAVPLWPDWGCFRSSSLPRARILQFHFCMVWVFIILTFRYLISLVFGRISSMFLALYVLGGQPRLVTTTTLCRPGYGYVSWQCGLAWLPVYLGSDGLVVYIVCMLSLVVNLTLYNDNTSDKHTTHTCPDAFRLSLFFLLCDVV